MESAVFDFTAATAGEVDEEDLSNLHRNLGTKKKKFQAIEDMCVKSVLMEADVVVSTCIGAGVRYDMLCWDVLCWYVLCCDIM